MAQNELDLLSPLLSSSTSLFGPSKQILTELIIRNQQLNDKVDSPYQHFVKKLEGMEDEMQHIKAENQQLKKQISDLKAKTDQYHHEYDKMHSRQCKEFAQKLDGHVCDMARVSKAHTLFHGLSLLVLCYLLVKPGDLRALLTGQVNQLQIDVQYHQNALGQLDIINYNVKRLMYTNYLEGMIRISPNARWKQNAITIVGDRKQKDAFHQFNNPYGLCLDDKDGILFIADFFNHRIMVRKQSDDTHALGIGGHGRGNRLDQLKRATDVLLDKEDDSLIVCEGRRVMRWSLRSGTFQGHTTTNNVDCWGLTIDKEGHLYVTDKEKHEVRRYEKGDKTKGTLVAGGNGKGDRLNQLNYPRYVFVDDEGAVYVSDYFNHRMVKWVKGATEGIVVAGGRGEGKDLTQLSYPWGVFVDAEGTVYVAEGGHNRVTRWRKGMEKGEIIVGGNGKGEKVNQFSHPTGLSFDRHGHLYVTDYYNHRVQRFDLL